jgi:Carbamoyl-phosphate synthetase large chain, oligomerisation domain
MSNLSPDSRLSCVSFTTDEIFNLTKIDRWFLVQIKEIVDFEEELATVS